MSCGYFIAVELHTYVLVLKLIKKKKIKNVVAISNIMPLEWMICDKIAHPGTGSSKKNARRIAAEKMLEKLQSLSGSTEITWVTLVFIVPLLVLFISLFWAHYTEELWSSGALFCLILCRIQNHMFIWRVCGPRSQRRFRYWGGILSVFPTQTMYRWCWSSLRSRALRSHILT